MKKIVILVLLLLAKAAAFAQCFDYGLIEKSQEGDTLKIFHVQAPAACVDPDSVRVTWWVVCNPFNHEEKVAVAVTGIDDTLKIPATGWRAVWATTSFYYDSLPALSGLSMSSNTVFFSGPDAPVAEIEVTPNPTDGHFSVRVQTNAEKHYLRIIGPWGMVYGGWFYGSGEKEFDLLPFNPNGLYNVIIDFHFDNICTGIARKRAPFIVQR